MFQFEWPWVLLLLPLPALVYFLFPVRADYREAALRVPFIDDFRFVQTISSGPNRQLWLLVLSLLVWILLVVAAARPQWLGESLSIDISGRDLMLAVDLSDSMRISDFKINNREVNRLTATKYVASQFIEKRQGDRLGLILFGTQAYLQTPLTFDTSTVNQLLLESAIGLAGERTAIGDAIGLALKRLDKSPQGSRVLILITDGANTAGEITPLKAAQLATEHDLKIYTIGIGADEQIKSTWFGVRTINPSSQLDEATLRSIADTTGGRYFRARDTEELEQIYALLDQLEPLGLDQQRLRPINALFYWPLAIALCLAGMIYLTKQWLQRI
ncbi:MAG: VWA domain-containing protein [Gammaproteobacteria bacterium]|nr:VWA domain-containing protein [Gammaproteobacteria bacterium]